MRILLLDLTFDRTMRPADSVEALKATE